MPDKKASDSDREEYRKYFYFRDTKNLIRFKHLEPTGNPPGYEYNKNLKAFGAHPTKVALFDGKGDNKWRPTLKCFYNGYFGFDNRQHAEFYCQTWLGCSKVQSRSGSRQQQLLKHQSAISTLSRSRARHSCEQRVY